MNGRFRHGLIAGTLVAGLVLAGVSGTAGASERSLDSTPSASLAGKGKKKGKAKLVRYRGTMANGGKVTLPMKFKRGKPRKLLGVAYKGVPAICDVTPPSVTIEGGIRSGVKLPGLAFQGNGENEGSTFSVTGQFSPNLKALQGQIQVASYFPPSTGLEETCRSARGAYTAARQ